LCADPLFDADDRVIGSEFFPDPCVRSWMGICDGWTADDRYSRNPLVVSWRCVAGAAQVSPRLLPPV
jgi:hypothetical protein